jgi:predicted DNA repair protein MutK
MPTGLVALLDDVSVIARAAAASIDDVGAAAGKAGVKAAGVVVDDTAVTPTYLTAFTPDRELPVVWKIARGSLFNKLVILLPVAIALSALLPAAIPVLLICGGLYLSFEGAEKVIEWLTGEHHGETLGDDITDPAKFEKARVSSAIRTDLILSAEIMAIALGSIPEVPLLQQAVVLAIVGVGITALVYGVVALIVKMDDIGLALARRGGKLSNLVGCGMVKAMPKLLSLISTVGTAAMLWVGGSIILHQLKALGIAAPEHMAEDIAHAIGTAAPPLEAALEWVAYAGLSAIVAFVLGTIIDRLIHHAKKGRVAVTA